MTQRREQRTDGSFGIMLIIIVILGGFALFFDLFGLLFSIGIAVFFAVATYFVLTQNPDNKIPRIKRITHCQSCFREIDSLKDQFCSYCGTSIG